MSRILLDTNCLIDLAEDDAAAAPLGVIVAASRRGLVRLAVAAITASENPRKGSPPKSWDEFSGLLARVGLADVEVLKSMGYWGVSFWDQGLWVGDDMLELEARIHAVLSPTLAIDDRSDERRWRNAKCDVQMVWTAMWNGVAVLISSDKKIVARSTALAAIRPIEVLTPASFLRSLEEGHTAKATS
jgi:hypothetical protein